MRSLLVWICVLLSPSLFAQESWQLATPLLRYHSLFYNDFMQLTVKFRHPGAVLYYTTDGTEPDENSRKYKTLLIIRQQKRTIHVKAFAPGFRPSETVALTFRKSGYSVKHIEGSRPDSSYTAKGAEPLTDNIGGFTDLHAGSWCGYKTDTITYYIQLEKKKELHRVLLDLLQLRGSWIYLPESVHISVLNELNGQYQPVIHETRALVTADEGIVVSTIYFPEHTTGQKLKLQIVPLQKIPAGLPGEKEKGWLFIDEIKIY